VESLFDSENIDYEFKSVKAAGAMNPVPIDK
jgi:hypothetical protein